MLALTACAGSAPNEPEGRTPLDGNWQYSGQQSGSPLTLTGVLAFSSKSAVSFDGSGELLESLGASPQRRMSGVIAGRMAGATSAEFDLSLGTLIRRHVGAVRADTLSGSWFETDATGGSLRASGTFRVVRTR